MLKKGILLTVVLVAITFLSISQAEARRGIVIPTAYGYGIVNGPAPYAWPAYGFSGMHPTIPVPASGMPAPAWNGASWSYQNATYPANRPQQVNFTGGTLAAVVSNLNIRAEPYVAGGKKRQSNVIGSLNAGEQVHILGRDGNWSYIQSANLPLRRGYVYSSYLSAVQNSLPAMNYPTYYSSAARAW